MKKWYPLLLHWNVKMWNPIKQRNTVCLIWLILIRAPPDWLMDRHSTSFSCSRHLMAASLPPFVGIKYVWRVWWLLVCIVVQANKLTSGILVGGTNEKWWSHPVYQIWKYLHTLAIIVDLVHQLLHSFLESTARIHFYFGPSQLWSIARSMLV